MNDDENAVLIEPRGPISIVTLNRPAHLNAVNGAMHTALATLWDHLAANNGETRAVILTGAGRAFSAGGDTGFMESFRRDPAECDRRIAESRKIVESLLAFPLPVIAAVNGPAVGLGCTLALLADFLLMAPKATLSDPHVNIGLPAGDGGALLWPIMAGVPTAKAILFTGDRLRADAVESAGLGKAVDDVLESATELATRLARQPADALAKTKRAVNMHFRAGLETAFEYALEAERKAFSGSEHAEALRALEARD